MSWIARNAFPIGLAAGFTLAVGLPSGDLDTYRHLASGQWVLDHHQILGADIFSSTVGGQPYSVGEWLGEIVLTLVRRSSVTPFVVTLVAAVGPIRVFPVRSSTASGCGPQ
jgi:hypothetical protein